MSTVLNEIHAGNDQDATLVSYEAQIDGGRTYLVYLHGPREFIPSSGTIIRSNRETRDMTQTLLFLEVQQPQ